MIKVSILYPNREDGRFDMDYYVNTHIPLSIQLFSVHPGFKGVSVDRGVSGRAPDAPPTYVVMCHFLFDSADSFVAAFSPNSPVLRADMPNYTDLEAIVQISEVVIAQ